MNLVDYICGTDAQVEKIKGAYKRPFDYFKRVGPFYAARFTTGLSGASHCWHVGLVQMGGRGYKITRIGSPNAARREKERWGDSSLLEMLGE